jgi:hypothetical protein
VKRRSERRTGVERSPLEREGEQETNNRRRRTRERKLEERVRSLCDWERKERAKRFADMSGREACG